MNTLTAAEGKYLTQVADVPTEKRIMVKAVSGFADLSTIYREATDAEYEEWKAQRDKLEKKIRIGAKNPALL